MHYNQHYMAVVSVRVEDEVLSILRAHKVNVSEVARVALADRARREQALEALDRLAKMKLPVHGPPSEEVIRQMRDERYARD